MPCASLLAACDANLARCIDGLADYFVRHAGAPNMGLALVSTVTTHTHAACIDIYMRNIPPPASSPRVPPHRHISTCARRPQSATGALVPRAALQAAAGQPVPRPDPAVEAFNGAVSNMRAALGADYLLALHLHKVGRGTKGRGVWSFIRSQGGHRAGIGAGH